MVQLPDELTRRLAAEAERRGKDINEVASEILAAGLSCAGPQRPTGRPSDETSRVPKATARNDGLGLVQVALRGVASGKSSWDRVCVVCAEALGITGTGIILMAGGELRTPLGASDEVEVVIEEAQFTLGEGPCVDAVRSAVPVHAPDLAGPTHTRWPGFSARAVDSGVAAIFALPLQVGPARVGAMNLYCDRPGPLTQSQLTTGLAIADLVTHAILDLQAHAPAEALAAGLAAAPFRAQVHQATGRISAQLDVGVAEALVRLRAYAYAHDRTIDDVAATVVSGALRFDDQAA